MPIHLLFKISKRVRKGQSFKRQTLHPGRVSTDEQMNYFVFGSGEMFCS